MRRACRLMMLAVTTYHYRSQRTDKPLRTKLVELAREKPRFGYRRLRVRGQALRSTLEWPTLDKIRRVMSIVYMDNGTNDSLRWSRESFETFTLTPEQACAVFMELEEPARTLTLLIAATGLRISEALGLRWWRSGEAESLPGL